MNARGMTQENVAAAAGVSVRAVAMAMNPTLVHGRIPPTVVTLAQFFGWGDTVPAARANVIRLLRTSGSFPDDLGPMTAAEKARFAAYVRASGSISQAAKRALLDEIGRAPSAD